MQLQNNNKNKQPEDVKTVSEIYDLHNYNYFDVSKAEKMRKILNKWPLLEETIKYLP